MSFTIHLDKDKVKKIDKKYDNGDKIKRSENIYYMNIKGLKKYNTIYHYDNEELSEYLKCKSDIFYFIDKYCIINGKKIVLYDFQKKLINDILENRFNIWMHSLEIGSTLIKSLIFLHKILFSNNESILIISNKLLSSSEILNKIRDMYINIPFFLKEGVLVSNNNRFILNNHSEIFIGSKFAPIGRNFKTLNINDFAFLKKDIFNYLVPVFLSLKDSNILLCSQPNGYNHFIKLIQKVEEGSDNIWNVIRTYYWVIKNRNEDWVDNKIKIIGKKNFNQFYKLNF